jgi:hypothetical protein
LRVARPRRVVVVRRIGGAKIGVVGMV